jgi:multidrug efflux pump
LQGVTPEDAERLLVRPIEQEIRAIEGLKTFEGIGAEGAGVVVLEFELTTDIDQAVTEVREKVDMAKRFFPEEAREPIVQEVNAAQFPVLVINLYGQAPERGLYTLAERLEQRLERHPAILEANVLGRREDVLEIVVDPVKLQDYNISIQEIFAVVTANNRLVPAGEIDTGNGSFAVKVPGLIANADDALALPIRRSGDAVITLADVADVRRTYLDATGYATFNGEPALLIEVVKRTGANVLETADIARAAIAAEQKTWPSTMQAKITSDASELIRGQLATLQSAVITAIVLVMIVCVAAVGLRSALLIGIAIPSSFLMAFLMLGAFGYTVNMMVMFGLVISVGILVDGAIIVVEYADRKMAEGLDKKQAFALAGKRMFWPVVGSTLTAMVAFVPFLFWNSLPGKFMAYLPITLIFVLAASLVMALIFLPALGSVFGKHTAGNDENLAAVAAHGDITKAKGILGAYLELVRELIRRPWMVSAGAIALIILIFLWFGARVHKTEFFLDIEPEQAYVFVQAQGALSAAEGASLVKRGEAAIANIDGIEAISTRTGVSQNGFSFDGVSGIPDDTIGQMLLDLATDDGVHNGNETLEKARAALNGVAGLRYEIKAREQGPPVGKDVQVALLSADGAALGIVAEKVAAEFDRLATEKVLRDVDDTMPLPGIEYRLQVDRAEAGKFGVDIAQVGAAVQLLTNGILVGRYRPDDVTDEVDIRVRLPEGERSASALDDLRIATPAGSVPLALFVDRVPAQRVTQINRRDGMRVIDVRANAYEQGTSAAIVADMKTWIVTQNFPASVDVRFEGADEETADAGAFFQGAAIAVLFMMGIILLWEFNNFWQVFLTLTAVVVSTAGVLIGIEVHLPYVSILMIGTGIVALAGIVVNHNIVLIDTFNRLREEGYSAHDAAIGTMGQRMRPVLLTTYTTVLGLLPSMFKMEVHFNTATITFGGAAAEWWVQLSTAIVYGLTFSTLMILFVTPVWLMVPTYVGAWQRRMFGRDDTAGDSVRLIGAAPRVDQPEQLLPAAE